MASITASIAENGILAAAVGVFRRCGFAATRVEDVLKAAGIARRTFYRYFSSKEDVLAAIYELTSAEILRAMARAAAETGDPFRGLHVGLDTYLDFHLEHAGLLRILLEQSIRSDSPLNPLRKKFREQLYDLLARAAEAKGLPRLDRYSCIALISALEGVSLHLLDEKAGPAEVEEAKRTLHRLLDGHARG
jgi:AcrR family transcriptional regulator